MNIIVEPAPADQSSVSMVASTNNSAIIAWIDQRNTPTSSDVYITRLFNNKTLPVNILEIGAQAIGKQVAVSWTSSNEKDLSHFAIERSNDGIAFDEAGTANARNSNGVQQYRFLDNTPMSGINYYRIKSVDIDGKFAYSNIAKVSVIFESDKNMHVFPNPAIANTSLQLNNLPAGKYTLRVVDMQGRTASTFRIDVNGSNRQTIQLPVDKLSRGTYQIQVINARGEQVSIEPMVKL
jgi:hypothetical protein